MEKEKGHKALWDKRLRNLREFSTEKAPNFCIIHQKPSNASNINAFGDFGNVTKG
nr:MAG TPA: hypothetical protein [Caudoviricetes sp.]